MALLPECLDDYIAEDTRLGVDAFVEKLDLHELGFEGAEAAATGRPAYHPSVLLKIYIYGYSTASSRAVGSSARQSETSS